MKRLLVLLGCLALVAVPTSASAVQYGEPDAGRHPWVGLMYAYQDGVVLWRCTGSLLDLDGDGAGETFLTAGHCVGEDPDTGQEPDEVRIWFDEGPLPAGDYPFDADPRPTCEGYTGLPCTGYDATGTPIEDPAWTGYLTIPDTHDVGIVVLDEPYVLDEYGQLAPVDYLDRLATRRGRQDVTFTVVGYGLQSVKPRESAIRQRMLGHVHLVNLRSALTDGFNLHYSSNPGQGQAGPGGTCFGDSGGPVIYNDPQLGEVIVGVNSFVLNSNCKGAGFAYRVDTAAVQEFIYAASPEA
jgi:hypothetical protein